MSFEFDGIKEIENKLKTTYSAENIKRINRKALKAGADAMLKMIELEQAKYADTGATVKSATMSEIIGPDDKMVIKVHWNDGTKPTRYNVIHLQENGFYNKDGTFNSPDSKGALQRLMIAGRKAYTQTIENELRKAFR